MGVSIFYVCLAERLYPSNGEMEVNHVDMIVGVSIFVVRLFVKDKDLYHNNREFEEIPADIIVDVSILTVLEKRLVS